MDGSEVETAWAEVRARWDDASAHDALLRRFQDLEGLAEVGRRYRAVLEERPDDAVARRWRDEVVKRATAVAMSQLPRTAPPPEPSRRVRRLVLAGVAALSALAIVYLWHLAGAWVAR